MIGRIVGTLLEKQPPHLMVDVVGLAYELESSMNTFYRLPELGQRVILYTHLHVREDALLLFGFYDQSERILFRTLIKVNGVGPKLALSILSSITPDEFVNCVMDKDTARLVQLPGIGKKTAERLLIEMTDRFTHWHSNVSGISTASASSVAGTMPRPAQEATSALIALGYKPQEASKAIANLEKNTEMTSEDMIRLALKAMVKK